LLKRLTHTLLRAINVLFKTIRVLFKTNRISVSPDPSQELLKKTDLKNAATMAISLLSNIEAEECYGNIYADNFNRNHCKNCYNGICNFLSLPDLKQIL